MIKTKREEKDRCSQCLRNIKGQCLALKEKQWPCWAFIDDQGEFERCEKERKNYLDRHNIA